jgi:hypothetical protein
VSRFFYLFFIIIGLLPSVSLAGESELQSLRVGRCEANLDEAHQIANKILNEMGAFTSSFRIESLEFLRDSSREIISVYTLTNGGMTRKALELDLEGVRNLSASIKNAKDEAIKALEGLSLERQFSRMSNGDSSRDRLRRRWNEWRGNEVEGAPIKEIERQLRTLASTILQINTDLEQSFNLIDSSMRILVDTKRDVERQVKRIETGLRVYNIIFLQVGRMILQRSPDLDIDHDHLKGLKPYDGVAYILDALVNQGHPQWSQSRIERMKEIIDWYRRGYSNTVLLKAKHLGFLQFLEEYYVIYRAYKNYQLEISSHFFNLSYDLVVDATNKIMALIEVQGRLAQLESRQNRISQRHDALARQAAQTQIESRKKELMAAMAKITDQSNVIARETHNANEAALKGLEDRTRFEDMIQAIRSSEETLHQELSRSFNE